MKVVKILRTSYGRTVIPKKKDSKKETLDALLEVRKLEMTPAERAVVERYLKGEASLETIQEELMKLPVEE